MRLRRLDLTRFGHFTDFSLDFGEHAPGRADLHIIFGPNEAGKTTAFEAYLDLLFGVPLRSQYNFLHDYGNMRIGACLEIDGAERELVRIKRRQNSLLDADGNSVNPAILARALGGMNREQYRAMFSLDDDTIEKGGDDILASHGDLGQLLFSAAAGLSDLSGVLDKAREAVDDFHKKSARKSYLAEARRKLKGLDKQIHGVDLNASRFRTLRAKLEAAETGEMTARRARDKLLGDKAQLDAVIECLPLLTELSGLHSNLEEVEDYTVFQETWIEQARELREREVAAQATETAAQNALDAAGDELLGARGELDEITDGEAEQNQAIPSVDDLRAILERHQPEDLIGQLREANTTVRREQTAVTDALANLVPWHEGADQLPVARVTEDQARRIAGKHTELKEENRAAQNEFGRVACELTGIQARLDTMETDASLFSDKDKQEARAHRDSVWNDHTQALTRETAGRFHEEMVRVDTIQDAQLEAADRLAQLREMQINVASLKAQKVHWKAQVDMHTQALEDEKNAFTDLLEEHSLPENFDPDDLQPWLHSLAGAHRATAAFVQAKEDQTQVQADIDRAEAALRKVLNAAPDFGDLSDLTRMARQTLEQSGRARAIQEQKDALVSVGKEFEDIATAVEDMATVFPDASEIETTEDFLNAVSNAKKADGLREDIVDLQRRIALRLGKDDFDVALEILEGADIPTATASLQAVEADLVEVEQTLEDAIGDLRAAQNELAAIGGDDAVARLQEKRQVLLLDIAEQARKSLRLQMGILLAEKALLRYRDTHRGDMLAATEKAFIRLTAGRYTRLATQPDGQNEVLLAVRGEDDRSISAATMSKGTRFQLYLALRLAGYGQFVADGTILPFITDDILETFDDTRTLAALDLLGEISQSGQALYFTHHKHVVDMARERLGDDCQIHDLSVEQ